MATSACPFWLGSLYGFLSHRQPALGEREEQVLGVDTHDIQVAGAFKDADLEGRQGSGLLGVL